MCVVGARNRTIDNYDSWLILSRHRRYARHVDILLPWNAPAANRCIKWFLSYLHPTSVEPEYVDRSILSRQLVDLVVSTISKALPTFRILSRVVVVVAIWSGPLRCPVIVTVPVGL